MMPSDLIKFDLNLLHIEDNEIDNDIVNFLVSQIELNYSVHICHALTLSAALFELDKRDDFDCILLDLHLSDGSGPEETIKTLIREHPNIPVIIISGVEDKNKAIQCLRAGAEDFLLKDTLDGYGLISAIEAAVKKKMIKDG